MSDYISKAFGVGPQNVIENIHTAFPALIISYNEVTHTATLQPIYKFPSGDNYPQIQNVPVQKQRYKIKRYRVNDTTGEAGGTSHSHSVSEYVEEVIEERLLLLQPGDMVLCICSEKSIDSIQSKRVHKPQSKRVFDISDAIVVCLL